MAGSLPVRFSKALQRFNAGWSSPVARQAHNLKVIGSNPIPATKYEAPAILIDCRGFFFRCDHAGRRKCDQVFCRDRGDRIVEQEFSRALHRDRNSKVDLRSMSRKKTRSEPVTSGRCDASRAATQTTPRSLPGKAGRRIKIPSDPAGRRETTGRVRALRLRKPSRQRPAAASCDIQIASIRIVPGPRIVALSLHSK